MSQNTPAPKTSFLTRAMQAVEAKKAAMASGEVEPTSEEAAGKRALKKFALVTAGTIAATAAAIVLINKIANEDEVDEDSEFEETTDETTNEN